MMDCKSCFNLIDIVFNTLTSIGTIGSVIVSLYLANRKPKKISLLDFYFIQRKDFATISLEINNHIDKDIIIKSVALGYKNNYFCSLSSSYFPGKNILNSAKVGPYEIVILGEYLFDDDKEHIISIDDFKTKLKEKTPLLFRIFPKVEVRIGTNVGFFVFKTKLKIKTK